MSEVEEFKRDLSRTINMLESFQIQEISTITTYNSVFTNEELLQFERSRSSSQESIDKLKLLRTNFAERIKQIDRRERNEL